MNVRLKHDRSFKTFKITVCSMRTLLVWFLFRFGWIQLRCQNRGDFISFNDIASWFTGNKTTQVTVCVRLLPSKIVDIVMRFSLFLDSFF